MPKLFIATILILLTRTTSAESYSCTHTLSDVNAPSSETKSTYKFDLADFAKSCDKGPCKKQFLIEGESQGDSDNISLIVHNGKPPVVAAMIWNLKLGTTKKFTEFGGLAGTDYRNRIYYQTVSGNKQHFVECSFQP